jgi:hypothetical protein
VNTRLLLAASLLLWAGTASAEQPLLVANIIEDCDLKIEFEPRDAMLHFRAGQPNGEKCYVTPDRARSELRKILEQRKTAPAVKLIFLGRMDEYHWLADRVAKTAARNESGWDRKRGQPRSGALQTYLANLLIGQVTEGRMTEGPLTEDGSQAGGILDPLDDVLAQYGYAVTGASTEKVMVDEISYSDGTPSGRYPVDALVHLRIAKKGG